MKEDRKKRRKKKRRGGGAKKKKKERKKERKKETKNRKKLRLDNAQKLHFKGDNPHLNIYTQEGALLLPPVKGTANKIIIFMHINQDNNYCT